ncbi:hypothetical protein GPECTOR_7g1059 [Gonium pectorale]|uniref:Uncharacterized protein n=1 Tax=Gonium pectorale TaxID=33097 RepID=A0A150GTH7_GONPE|nr:hypothetical protein GPECTOR_7g1059 [Gonium pectorale]|eukprot:KXZ53167.1 hypothetical protein GPECTOR_7g1059 [Gonium pectorale]
MEAGAQRQPSAFASGSIVSRPDAVLPGNPGTVRSSDLATSSVVYTSEDDADARPPTTSPSCADASSFTSSSTPVSSAPSCPAPPPAPWWESLDPRVDHELACLGFCCETCSASNDDLASRAEGCGFCCSATAGHGPDLDRLRHLSHVYTGFEVPAMSCQRGLAYEYEPERTIQESTEAIPNKPGVQGGEPIRRCVERGWLTLWRPDGSVARLDVCRKSSVVRLPAAELATASPAQPGAALRALLREPRCTGLTARALAEAGESSACLAPVVGYDVTRAPGCSGDHYIWAHFTEWQERGTLEHWRRRRRRWAGPAW